MVWPLYFTKLGLNQPSPTVDVYFFDNPVSIIAITLKSIDLFAYSNPITSSAIS